MPPVDPFQVLGTQSAGDAVVFQILIPTDSAYFSGHFPGRPILPAIGQLAILSELIRRTGDLRRAVSCIDHARFSRPVLPGEQIEVRIECPRAAGEARFKITHEGAAVSSGTLQLATSDCR